MEGTKAANPYSVGAPRPKVLRVSFCPISRLGPQRPVKSRDLLRPKVAPEAPETAWDAKSDLGPREGTGAEHTEELQVTISNELQPAYPVLSKSVIQEWTSSPHPRTASEKGEAARRKNQEMTARVRRTREIPQDSTTQSRQTMPQTTKTGPPLDNILMRKGRRRCRAHAHARRKPLSRDRPPSPHAGGTRSQNPRLRFKTDAKP